MPWTGLGRRRALGRGILEKPSRFLAQTEGSQPAREGLQLRQERVRGDALRSGHAGGHCRSLSLAVHFASPRTPRAGATAQSLINSDAVARAAVAAARSDP